MADERSRFDAIVLGAGPAGGHAVTRLAEQGLRTALVEQELVGGECAYWACIPSKTLLRPPEVRFEAQRAPGTSAPAQRWQEIVAYRDYMVRELDDADEIEEYEQAGTAVFKERGRLDGAGKVELGGRTIEAERIVIATGSETALPAIDGLEQAGYWTNREATTLREVPESVAVLGGGPVGIELAQMLSRFGARVHVIEPADRLLSREPQRVGELVLEAVREDGIEVHLGAEARSVTRESGLRVVRLDDGSEIAASELLVASGGRPRMHEIGLETVGIELGDSGIEVDERCRAGEGIWAVGDVTGTMPFTHAGMYQARIACADIAGESARADYNAIPRVVFSDPEVAAVGRTSEGPDVVCERVKLAEVITRPSTYETEPRGELAVLADRERGVLVGAWAVAPLASEWIHYAALAIKAQIPIAVLRDTVAQFPTYTEAYFKALDRMEL